MLAPRRLPPARRDQAIERAVQTRMILARERSLEATLARLVGAVGRRAAQAYATDGAGGATAAAQRATDELARAMRPALTATAQEFARRLVNSPKCAHAFATKSFADLDGAIANHVAQHTAEAVVGISASLRETIRRVIERAIAENLGQEETAELIVEATAGEIAMARARRIARTEIHFAAMYGQQAAAEASPLAFEKVWLATEDSRTRKGHADANGQRVPLDGRFELVTQQGNTITLRHPGDTDAPPGEIIACRCVCLYEPLALPKDQVEPADYGPDDLPDDDPGSAEAETPGAPEIDLVPEPGPIDLDPTGYGPDDPLDDTTGAPQPPLAPEIDLGQPEPEPDQEVALPVDEMPAMEPEVVQLPERDLEQRPFEREALLLWAAGVTLDTDASDTPRVGEVVSLRGPNVLYDNPDFAEVDREVARGGGGFLNLRRAQVWRVTVPAGPALPPTLFQRAGGGWIVNSGISRFGLVTLRVTRVEKTRWGDAAPKGFVDPSRLSTFARGYIEERLLQLRAGELETDEVAAWLANRIEAARDEWPAPPWELEAVIARLRQPGWDGEDLVAYIADIDTSLLTSRTRDSALQAIELVERPHRMTAAEAAQSLGASLEGERMGEPLDGYAAPESVIRTLLDTSWTVRALTRWLEQLLAGQVRDEPGPGEPDAHQRVIVIHATMDVAGAVPEGYTWET